MSRVNIEDLLRIVGPRISKANAKMRDAIPAAERLIVTLRYLATGDTYSSLQYTFRIPPTTLSRIIPEVCEAIYIGLKDLYLKTPSTSEGWKDVAAAFDKKWNFPQCLGALDGKHVVMQAPQNSGSYYYNYKGTHSIVLLALVDATLKILYFDIGCNGRVTDGGVFGNCSLSSALENNTVQMPPPSSLPGRQTPVPDVIVADDAFAMKRYLIKPYPMRDQPGPNRVFNYRLSRARRTSENWFGLMANKFRVLRTPILLCPDRTEKVAKAICALHNFLLSRKESALHYSSGEEVDNEDPTTGEVRPGTWRKEGAPSANMINLSRCNNNNYSLAAKDVRDEYRDFFISPQGEVPWFRGSTSLFEVINSLKLGSILT